jgi:hypothetical protein
MVLCGSTAQRYGRRRRRGSDEVLLGQQQQQQQPAGAAPGAARPPGRSPPQRPRTGRRRRRIGWRGTRAAPLPRCAPARIRPRCSASHNCAIGSDFVGWRLAAGLHEHELVLNGGRAHALTASLLSQRNQNKPILKLKDPNPTTSPNHRCEH